MDWLASPAASAVTVVPSGPMRFKPPASEPIHNEPSRDCTKALIGPRATSGVNSVNCWC